ncbi:MAG: biotin--[acetyl-CoA-carboxylase] ligase, partial [Thermoplasmata archaeon]
MEKKIKKIYLLKEIDSTQNYAKTLIDTGLNPLDRTLIIAKKQSEGRGRFYRKWHSPPGGIYLSFILSNFEIIQRICIDTSLALVKLTKELYGLQVYIKWPNDIILENKKLSGI